MPGIPGQLVKATRVGSAGLLKWILKNWYWIVFIIIIFPAVILAIQTSVETKNPLYPILELGIHITNADSVIYEDVKILEKNPTELIGMEKPSEGRWLKIRYAWSVTKLVWIILGLVWLITFPFVIIYKIVRLKQTSEPAKNVWKTMKIGLLFVFIMNMLLALYNVLTDSIIYTFPENADIFVKMGIIVWTTIPFHGLFSLIKYLITLF